jgi:hypothetical protein
MMLRSYGSALIVNIRLGGKTFTRTNTLAYFAPTIVTRENMISNFDNSTLCYKTF